MINAGEEIAMGGLGALGSFFGGNKASGDYGQDMQQGMNQIGQYLNQAEGYEQPYRDAGQFGLSGYENLLGQMGNGMGYYNNIMSNYQMTPGAKFRLHNGMNMVQNALASQGLGASGNQQKALTNYTQGVINQDQNQYLNNVLGINRMALGGYGDLSHLGGWAAQNSGQYAMDAGQDMASMYSAMANAKAKQDNARTGGLFGGLGMIGQGLMNHFYPSGGGGGSDDSNFGFDDTPVY